jgi:hypothetical protein
MTGNPIIAAPIILAMLGYAWRYLAKRKEARDLALAKKEHQEMQEFLADPKRANQWKAVQLKCQFFASAYASDKESLAPEIRNNADAMRIPGEVARESAMMSPSIPI